MNRKQKVAVVVGVVVMLDLAGCGAESDSGSEGVPPVPTSGADEQGERAPETDIVLRYFDVKDLLPPIDTLVGNPPFKLPPASPPQAPASREDPAALTEEALIAFIRERTEAHATWSDDAHGEGGSLEIRNSIVIARNTAAVLDLVVQVLDEIRASGDPFAHVGASR